MVPQASAERLDRLRTAVDSVFAKPEYQWREATDPWAPLRRAWLALQDWVAQLRTENPVAYRVLVWTLVGVLAAIVLHAAWVAARTVRGGSEREAGEVVTRGPAPRDAAWHRGEAARLAAAGRFVEAMQADFVRLVLELDGRRAVRFHASKTPHEYVLDPGLRPQARDDLDDLVRSLYAHAFGRRHCDAAAWASWRDRATVERYAAAN